MKKLLLFAILGCLLLNSCSSEDDDIKSDPRLEKRNLVLKAAQSIHADYLLSSSLQEQISHPQWDNYHILKETQDTTLFTVPLDNEQATDNWMLIITNVKHRTEMHILRIPEKVDGQTDFKGVSLIYPSKIWYCRPISEVNEEETTLRHAECPDGITIIGENGVWSITDCPGFMIGGYPDIIITAPAPSQPDVPWWVPQIPSLPGSGTGGGGSSASAIGGITSKNQLSASDREKLKKKIEEMIQNCGYQKMFEYMDKKGIKLDNIKIDPSINSPAHYDHIKNEIVFQSSAMIDNGRFTEEFIHFFQNYFYSGGLSKYNNVGRINIEFEAKIIQDILCYNYNPSTCSYYGAVGSQSLQYMNWIQREITGIPTYSQIQDKYWKYMENFRVSVPEYNYPIDKNLQPQVLDYLNKNACK